MIDEGESVPLESIPRRRIRRSHTDSSRTNSSVSSGTTSTDETDDAYIHPDKGTAGEDDEDEEHSSSEEEPDVSAPLSSRAFGSPMMMDSNFDAAFGEGFSGLAFAGSSAFESDVGNFPTDFASFPAATDVFSSGPAGNDDGMLDYEPPTFGFTDTFGGVDTLSPPPQLYDKSPIENPPVDQVGSATTKIKWISPRPVLIQSSSPAPVANPLSGHLILCRQTSGIPRGSAKKEFSLVEWNPHSQTQVISTPILTVDLHRKVSQKYKVTPSGVDNVLTLSVGVHRTQGYSRTRVAALMDLRVLENKEVLRVIAVWQWGYGGSDKQQSHPVHLQSVLSPPSGSDFSYNTDSLIVSDSCVFVSGASTKGPCVFLCKPTVRETWSANFVGKESSRIASMAVTTCENGPADLVTDNSTSIGNNYPERLPYLAIALTDGTISVWTYEAATRLTAKSTEPVRRLLFPLCRLEGVQLLKGAPSTTWSNKEKPSESHEESGSMGGVGYCTHLEWVSPRGSSFNQLQLLSASFQGGLCLYHISLPKVQDKSITSKKEQYIDVKPPTEKTSLSQTVLIQPFCLSKWSSIYQRSIACFVDLGPHVPPTLAVLMTGLGSNVDYARLALVTCPLESFGSTLGSSSTKSPGRLSFHVWDSHEWTKRLSHLPRGLISSAFNTKGVVYYSDTAIQEIEYRTNTRFPYMAGGVGSIPVGLTTSGTAYWADSPSTAGTSVLSIYTTYHCERRKVSSSSDGSSPSMLEWTPPSRRHWLIQTFIGDTKESSLPGKKGSNNTTIPVSLREEKDGDDVMFGGSQSTVVCELSVRTQLYKLYPYRILRNPMTTQLRVAVWFRPLYGKSEEEQIGLVEMDENGRYGVAQVLDGRDVVFLPNLQDGHENEDVAAPSNTTSCSNGIPQALIVSKNGGSVALWQRKGDSGALKSPWAVTAGEDCRPILGLDEGSGTFQEDFVECRQLTLVQFQTELRLLVVASKASGKCCILAGPWVPREGLAWQTLLPNIQEDVVMWLNDREQVTLVVPLPHEGSIQGGVGVATTHRVLVLSPDLNIVAEVAHSPPPGSLVPLGSYTVAYCSHRDHKLHYLCGLPNSFGRSGLIASFPTPFRSYCPNWLVGIRPDRFLYNSCHNGTRLVERGQPSHSFLLPTAVTRPALLLEPMIANAIATGGNETAFQPFLRTVVEKFGRKVATMTHGEDEGIGNWGAGISPRVYELLSFYNLKAAASWLLTGTIAFDRSANSRLLPSWMPASAKINAALDTDTHLHVVSNGDQYFTEYIKSPDTNMSSILPPPSDPSSLLCKQFALDAIKEGNYVDALKMLDIVGTESMDAIILQLSFAMQVNSALDVTPILDSLYRRDSQIGKANSTAVASMAALAIELKNNATPGSEFNQRWMQSLAPSFQRGKKAGRHRNSIMGESALSKLGAHRPAKDGLFSREIPESKLVWNEGPNREKENLLMLDHVQEWFGRRRPVILGKEGARSAEDRGASTLADILHSTDDDSFGAENDDFKDGWVDGVGEGLKDEDKLSAYFRFSEGEDDEATWREEGFADIGKFESNALLIGCSEYAGLQKSSSNVDEGESGKVKGLYDLVFEQSGVGVAAGLAISASRGGSLDVGIMHGPDHASRQKCSIEFWFWVPETVTKEIVLVRRSFGSSADDFDAVCKASNKNSVLWELSLKTNGELMFRTISGASIKTEPQPMTDNDADQGQRNTVVFSRWNHICVTIKQELSITNAAVNVFLQGTKVANSDSLKFAPAGFQIDDFSGASGFDPMLEKSHLLFGLDHPKGFRLTELRVWALERSDDDIRTLMTEYLECAEIKKKFKVKIKKMGLGDKLAIVPPKGSLMSPGLLGPAGGGKPVAAPRALMSPPGTLKPPSDGGRAFARKGLLSPPKEKNAGQTKPVTPSRGSGFEGAESGFGGFDDADATTVSFGGTDFGGRASGSTFESHLQGEHLPLATPDSHDGTQYDDYVEEEMPEISPLWDSAIPLSEQVRSSAAAALIRGPPATRHFGGNRGGLPDYRELERLGVGAISICGSEKTIVWRDDQVPPGQTYPIGASGAVVSDQMDEEGSEFLCCFLAKDKRMVVFELSTRTVVVELQMTTKLNYWRFLPPEAGEDTLCFMLVTPVGGFHWMPLDESPRPRQVWKRGPELQGKKIVSYEEGGTNGLDGPDMLSKVGMLLVTNNAGDSGCLEAWLVPICGDSQVICASE